MELVLLAVILFVNVGLWWRLRSDDAFLTRYVRTSPKAFLWRKLLGEERAAEVIRTRLVPLGIVVWSVLMLAGGGARLYAAWAG